MGELPGRKSVIMFSDGFTIFDREDPAKRQRVLENLRRLVDLANRSSVVVYIVDALGTALTPGEYVLQVVVTDSLAKGKYRTATQWIDFEMVK